MISSSSLGSKKGLLWVLEMLSRVGQVPPHVEAESWPDGHGASVDVDWAE